MLVDDNDVYGGGLSSSLAEAVHPTGCAEALIAGCEDARRGDEMAPAMIRVDNGSLVLMA